MYDDDQSLTCASFPGVFRTTGYHANKELLITQIYKHPFPNMALEQMSSLVSKSCQRVTKQTTVATLSKCHEAT